ncbi:MAG: CAP domain-containing protein [Oligoflexia bacterium]|nr:CAP domain-containing protein [Oligoflexia bacterium]
MKTLTPILSTVLVFTFSILLPIDSSARCSSCEVHDSARRIGEREAREVFYLTNKIRRRNGLSPLRYDVGACKKMAQKHADFGAKYALRGKLGHTNFYKRVKNAGLGGKYVAENVVWQGSSHGASPERAIKLWLNSKPHRAQILSRKSAKIGIGVAKDSQGNTYWVQCFTK